MVREPKLNMIHRAKGRVLKSQRRSRSIKTVPGVGNMNGTWVWVDSKTRKFVLS